MAESTAQQDPGQTAVHRAALPLKVTGFYFLALVDRLRHGGPHQSI
ncbi:hypothetical protein [Streptomyces glaucus]|uniref:Uncharacterized protein n=1 Tax=Streptomyces glaucus TaxID=284029 RepID=A0ABN3JBQ4_9ACTN